MRVLFTSLLALILTAAPSSARADNHALVAGGGCETVGSDNTGTGEFIDTAGKAAGHWSLFRPSFETTVRALSANGWDTAVEYDADIWQRPWPHSGPFTKSALIDTLKGWIKTAKPRDQYLLSIDTHGSVDPHYICLGDGSLMKISEIASYVKKLAGKKGVNVAVVDSSCYSGNSVSQLASTGACILSGSPPNVTGSGDTIIPYLFGLGLPKGARVPSFYTQAIPDASADLDGDGRISAAEAFAYARQHMSAMELPMTSDCDLGSGRIRELVCGSAPVFRPGTGAKRENLKAEEEGATGSDACAAVTLATSLDTLATSLATQAVLLRTESDLAALGVASDLGLRERASRLRTNALVFARLLTSHERDQNAADDLLAKRRAVPPELTARLAQGDQDALNLRLAIFKDLRPLIQLACEQEKAASPNRDRPCERFDLFPKRAGT